MPTNEWQRELAKGRATLGELQHVLGCYTIDLGDEKLRSRFVTRRGMVPVKMLPDQFCDEAYRAKEKSEGWRLPELLVSVPIYWLKKSDFFSPASDLGCISNFSAL